MTLYFILEELARSVKILIITWLADLVTWMVGSLAELAEVRAGIRLAELVALAVFAA